MALDIFAVEPHGSDPNRSSAPARPEFGGGFTALLLSALANKGLAGSILAPGLEIARSHGTEPGPDTTHEPKGLARAETQDEVSAPVDEEPAAEDTTGEADDVDSNDAESNDAENRDAAPEDADAGDADTAHDTADVTVADGPHVPVARAFAPRGGVAEAGSLASLLTQVSANEAALSAVDSVMPAAGAAPVHAAAQAASAAVVQQAQNGARAATVLATAQGALATAQGAQAAQTAPAVVAGKSTGPTIPNTNVTQSAPGLMSRPNAVLAPGAALAAMATDAPGRGFAVSAATMPQADTQGAAHTPMHKTMPATANGTPAAPHLTSANTLPAPGSNGSAPAPTGVATENASLRADRPDPAAIGIPQAAAKGQAQAQSTPAGMAAARADAIIAPAAPTAPTPTQLATAASRPAPMAQAILPLSGSAAGSGAHNGDAGANFNALFQRAGAQTAATTKPLIHRPLPPNTTAAGQIAINIQRAATAGTDRIQIRMVPAELGRVDVRLEMSRGQRIKAVIMAEKQETLDLLIRDARQLERALQQAGLQLDHDSLEFSLRDGNAGAAMAQDNGTGAGDGTDTTGDESDIAGDSPLADTAHAEIITDDHIDVHV